VRKSSDIVATAWALSMVLASGGAAQGPVSIFNGRDLDGWTIHGTELWYVEDGELICESGPDAEYGYLATERTYRDFELTVDFRQEADGNSGVFFHSSLEGTVITGWQAEVAPPGLWTGGIYESYGRGWLVQPTADKDEALRMGEWNTMRVRVEGDHVTTWLNDVEMIALEDSDPIIAQCDSLEQNGNSPFSLVRQSLVRVGIEPDLLVLGSDGEIFARRLTGLEVGDAVGYRLDGGSGLIHMGSPGAGGGAAACLLSRVSVDHQGPGVKAMQPPE